jgi:hypothetical protein
VPHCGQDSAEVLAEAGYSKAEIEAMRADGVTEERGSQKAT